MPRLRLSVRLLMALIAFAALAMAVAIMARRSGEFRALAEEQADAEQLSLSYADEARGPTGDRQRVAGRADGRLPPGAAVNRPPGIPGSPSRPTRRSPSRRREWPPGQLRPCPRSLRPGEPLVGGMRRAEMTSPRL